jgi:hypothetical protein
MYSLRSKSSKHSSLTPLINRFDLNTLWYPLLTSISENNLFSDCLDINFTVWEDPNVDLIGLSGATKKKLVYDDKENIKSDNLISNDYSANPKKCMISNLYTFT